MKRALLQPNGRLSDFCAGGDEFEVHEGLPWIDVPNHVTEQYRFDGENFVPPPVAATDDVGNYQARRRAEYPPIGDQLDVIWKQVNKDRLDGDLPIPEADDMLNDILAVKARHPKP